MTNKMTDLCTEGRNEWKSAMVLEIEEHIELPTNYRAEIDIRLYKIDPEPKFQINIEFDDDQLPEVPVDEDSELDSFFNDLSSIGDMDEGG